MLYLEFLFPLGRYHATPWGRHVNEGVVEWPPSPFRIARAVAALAWIRRPDWGPARIGKILELFQSLPEYALPSATTAHTRYYLSQNETEISKKTLIFDAFVVMEPLSSVYAAYDANPDAATLDDLMELMAEMNYLGRSESWVQARVLSEKPVAVFNCRAHVGGSVPPGYEIVDVACVRPAEEYAAAPYKPENAGEKKKKKSGNASEKQEFSWTDALCLDTSQWIEEGWTEHPGMKTVPYLRPVFSRGMVAKAKSSLGSRFTVARFALESTVLPLVTDALPVAERIRRKLMGIDRYAQGGNGQTISHRFSGKKEGNPDEGHNHVYILPVDENGDGRLDHVLILSREPFTDKELHVLDRCTSFWQEKRPDVQMILNSLLREPPQSSCRWVSHTPFVTRRHWRKGRKSFEEWLIREVRQECLFHGLPEPVEVQLHPEKQPQAGHPFFWVEFRRSRKNEPPLRGYGFTLVFDQEVSGPFALGALAHFGIGTFLPATDTRKSS